MKKFCLMRVTKRNGTDCREVIAHRDDMTASEVAEIYCRKFTEYYGYRPPHAFQAHEGDWISALIACHKLA